MWVKNTSSSLATGSSHLGQQLASSWPAARPTAAREEEASLCSAPNGMNWKTKTFDQDLHCKVKAEVAPVLN
jgi:hypothetical protein